MSSKEIGGGGRQYSSLKQLLVAIKYGNFSNIVKDGIYTIIYSADSEYSNTDCLASNAANFLCDFNSSNREDIRWWCSSVGSFPHWWQVDLGRVVSNVCRFIFNPSDDVVYCRVKDYELSYSLDGTNFIKIYSGTFVPEYTIKPHVWQDVDCEFNPVNLRYFRITILSSYAPLDGKHYTWAGFSNARLYAKKKCLYLKESDNNIYGYINNEITKITTLDTWNKSSKEDKENFLISTKDVLSVDQLKSLGKFKVLNEPKS